MGATTPTEVEAPGLEEIRAARDRIAAAGAIRTPLVPLTLPGGREVWLKLELLQPIGSFKIRGPANALALASAAALERGVWTASAGNHGQGLAWCARRGGVACTVVVPEHAPRAKVDALVRLGARVVPAPLERWWNAIATRSFPGMDGLFFVHPTADRDIMAGNGTIGLEILEDLPDVDAILAPYGGGGLACGIAAALAALRPAARVHACEVSTATPCATSLAAGRPSACDHTTSFVDGIGGRSALAEMWPCVSRLVAGSIVVTPDEVAEAVRLLLARVHVAAEGAGAVPVAAAASERAPSGRIACVVSGGNIDAAILARILRGETPAPGAA